MRLKKCLGQLPALTQMTLRAPVVRNVTWVFFKKTLQESSQVGGETLMVFQQSRRRACWAQHTAHLLAAVHKLGADVR